jgi:hypothetical protein
MITNASSNSKQENEPAASSEPTPQKAQLALPEASHDPSIQLDVSNGGTTIKLDHLGPMVVSVDGTLSRISNWHAMTDGEKENTIRIIGKRNKKRLDALKARESGK